MGGNHHEDPVIIIALTSSRIDSLRASQYLVDYKCNIVLLIINVKRLVTDQRPLKQVPTTYEHSQQQDPLRLEQPRN
jgi:hypothetical protein